MRVAFFLLMSVLVTSSAVRAAESEEKPNCKLTIQIFMKSGKKKVTIDEIHTASRDICAAEAQVRRLAGDEDPEEVENTKVVFSWRELN